MQTLSEIAATAMDLYHQNYAKDDEFFDLPHFQFMCANAYSRLLIQDYENAKAENRAILNFSFVSLPSAWVKEKVISISPKNEGCPYYTADLADTGIVSFPFDSLDSGIQAIYAKGTCESAQFVKVAAKDTWRIRLLPTTGHVFYYRVGCELRFNNVKCDLKEIIIQYLPDITSEDGSAEIPAEKVIPLINVVLQLQIAARDGKMQDFSIDSNANMIPQTEINKQQA